MSFPTDLVYFGPQEFRYPDNMDVGFLRWLDRVRARAGVPFHITNDWRANGKGLHGRGMAVDLDSRQWSAADKWRVNAALVALAVDAPGAVEFEPVYNAPREGMRKAIQQALGTHLSGVSLDVAVSRVMAALLPNVPTDRHWHIGVDPRPNAVGEFVEADD